jgi:hypothetical protein
MTAGLDPLAAADAAWTHPRPNGRDETRQIEAPQPKICVRAGFRHKAADEGLVALWAAGMPFYQRNRSLVRVCMVRAKAAGGEVTPTPGIIPVTHAMLGRALGRVAIWERPVGKKGKELARIDPPRPVVEQIADMAGEWPFPPLAGVIGTPTMRSDGTLLIEEGYDDATGLVLIGSPPMPSMPSEPTKRDAEIALALIDGLLDEFPFADIGKATQSINRAVALSQLMTPVLRGALAPAVPLHVDKAPQPGTGKSYLADIASMMATGDRCAVIAAAPKPEETEKRLVAAALAGFPIIALDNCSDVIEGDFLCQVTERPILQLRPLGTSEAVRVANTFSVFTNGNNATVAGDMVRRTLQCALDANMENPETRQFRADPVAEVRQNRGAFIAACLTIARAYICAGMPCRLPPIPSFGAWSDLVRSPLVWLDRPDPVETMRATRSADPVRQIRTSVFTAWAQELGMGGAYLTSDLVDRANDRAPNGEWSRPNIRSALLDIARDRSGDIDSRRLGKWLSTAENNVANGLKLTSDRGNIARPRWVLVPA